MFPGFVETDTENARVLATFLRSLVERALVPICREPAELDLTELLQPTGQRRVIGNGVHRYDAPGFGAMHQRPSIARKRCSSSATASNALTNLAEVSRIRLA